jgi:hypothetical protein
MNNKQIASHIEAIMFASGLDPVMDEDYYQGVNGESIGRFCEAMCCFFKIERDAWMFHFNNIEWLDSPSATIAFFIKESDQLKR